MLHIIPQILLYTLHSTVGQTAHYPSSDLATQHINISVAHHSSNLASQTTQHCITKCRTSFLKYCYTYYTALFYHIDIHINPKSCFPYYTALYIIQMHIIPQILLHRKHSTIYHSVTYHSSILATHITQHYISYWCTSFYKIKNTARYIIVLRIIPQFLQNILHSTIYHTDAHHSTKLKTQHDIS